MKLMIFLSYIYSIYFVIMGSKLNSARLQNIRAGYSRFSCSLMQLKLEATICYFIAIVFGIIGWGFVALNNGFFDFMMKYL